MRLPTSRMGKNDGTPQFFRSESYTHTCYVVQLEAEALVLLLVEFCRPSCEEAGLRQVSFSPLFHSPQLKARRGEQSLMSISAMCFEVHMHQEERAKEREEK